MKIKFIKKGAMFGLDARIKKLYHIGLDPVSHALNNKHAAMFGLDNQKKENCHPELGSGSHEVNAKHGAMFGLDARIKKLCHTGLDPVSHALNNKHGAMFGLDARIALSIFGALSVISGAALYSAIQSANAERWRQFFENVIKSTDAYYLDTYKKLPIYSAANLQLDARQLASNTIGINNWNGPYLNGQALLTGGVNGLIETNRHKRGLGFAGEVRVYLRTGSNWSKNDDLITDGHCVINNSDCFEYVSLYETHGLGTRSYKDMYQIFTSLDNLIDNNDGELAGKVRYMDVTVGHGIFYKSNPRVYRG